MNKKRRGEIDGVLFSISRAKIEQDVESAACIVEQAIDETRSIMQDEQDCLDNMPENLEGSEQYSKMEDAVDHLDDAIGSLEDAVDVMEDEGGSVDDAIPSLDEAADSLEKAKE